MKKVHYISIRVWSHDFHAQCQLSWVSDNQLLKSWLGCLVRYRDVWILEPASVLDVSRN